MANPNETPEVVDLAGRVVRTVYHSDETRYTVLRVTKPGDVAVMTLVGHTGPVEDGAEIEARGKWIVHPVHGDQFQFQTLRMRPPSSPEGIKRRLANYPRIKSVMADRIVERFGEDTLTILDKQPRRLLEVEGIGPKTLAKILEHHAARSGPVAELENLLFELNLPARLAVVLDKRYGERAIEMLQQQPYRLAREVAGIGFLTADRIARAQGVELDSVERIDAGLLHALEQAERDGHCALPRTRLREAAAAILALGADKLEEGIGRLVDDGDLLEERHDEHGTLCFPRERVFAEEGVATALADLALAEKAQWTVEGLPDHLSDGQVRAVEAIAKNGVVILTGGPGTGKSTVVRQAIELAAANGMERWLGAPTGRAAKRLEQTTGETARTIHRLLEIQGDTGEFLYNANNPLPEGFVVIDEASMLDLQLAEALFTSLTTAHRLMIVGDADQLPSVGPGNVLRDLIQASAGPDSPIPVVRLDKIFRQEEGSSIVVNAHRVLSGRNLDPDPAGAGGQFFFIRARDAERAHEVLVKMATERIPEAYGLDPVQDIQVLCPMHKGRAGTEVLNRSLQEAYTKGQPEMVLRHTGPGPDRRFRVGDRVMQTRNDYNKNVFNGDIGTVTSVDDEEEEIVVEIDGSPVTYAGKEAVALRLAYAVSIHKSQGSEFPAVLIPLLTEHHVMLRRNLLYTAMTRARRLCVVVGDPRAVDRAIHRGDAALRFTGLADRVRALFEDRLGGPRFVLDPGADQA